MWQLLLAATAAAGSVIFAKKLISLIDTKKPISDCAQNDLECHQSNNRQERGSFNEDAKVFSFSSLETGFKESRKINRNGFKGVKKNGASKRGKKNVAVVCGRKEVSICLKKRKTGKNVAGKCEFCASKDRSVGWGVGVGVMYMMSAELTKLNSAMDQTVKTVQELKAEISSRRNLNVSVAENEAETHQKFVERSCNDPLFISNNIKSFDPTMTEEGEHISSTLMVDQQPEELEMHRLEVELESQLQKLTSCATEASGSEETTYAFEAEDWSTKRSSENFESWNSYQYNHGVVPAELDKKLCHLLIEQQESQIVELENELHHAHSKLHHKETELQALKDCVKRLTQFSLANASDGETEDDIEEKLGFESSESVVGMKYTFVQ